MKKSITITPVHVADLLAEGERMPVYVHVIDLSALVQGKADGRRVWIVVSNM